ncbi:MAG: hypothetical protein ACRDV7_13090 [Acidimicrobiia bacterium]
MGIVDDLLANPGLYIGIDRVMDSDLRGAARIAVTPLPGRVGVALDYEVYNGSMPENPRGHVEHTLIARAHSGKVIMVIADTHSGALTILEEGEPGVFEPEADAALPYPVKVVVTFPEPGRLRHAWWYGSREEGAVERDVSELTLTT